MFFVLSMSKIKFVRMVSDGTSVLMAKLNLTDSNLHWAACPVKMSSKRIAIDFHRIRSTNIDQR